jgi:tripartite ATP-independent transporter DctM subunit
MTAGLWALALVLGVSLALLAGYPVAFTLAGVSLLFAGAGLLAGAFDPAFLEALPNRVSGIMLNDTLVAVPLFIFMGVMLERSRIAERLLEAMSALFGGLRGGLGMAVILVGALLAASTGIVGATVVTMGLISLPAMLRHGYSPGIACGAICASGTLGQIIPPSVILVLLGDVLGNAWQQAQLARGEFAPQALSVGDLFAGAMLPGLLLVLLYLLFLAVTAWRWPALLPAAPAAQRPTAAALLRALLPAFGLILAVLGSILAGLATPTEAAALGALLLALLEGQLDRERLEAVMHSTLRLSAMVFSILIGAALFSLVFRGFGGDGAVEALLGGMPGGVHGAFFAVMLVMFALGFVLDFIEIIYVVVPIVGPVLLGMGLDPVWLGVMMAVNLQTSFLTPPFGFALFYLRGVAPPEVSTTHIYRGVLPFIALQLLGLGLLAWWPALATWLPSRL